MRTIPSLALMLALSAPAFACLNDAELISHEREFKSQYEGSEYQPPQPTQASSTRPYLIGSAGVLMAVAGFGVLLRLRSQPK